MDRRTAQGSMFGVAGLWATMLGLNAVAPPEGQMWLQLVWAGTLAILGFAQVRFPQVYGDLFSDLDRRFGLMVPRVYPDPALISRLSGMVWVALAILVALWGIAH